MTVVATRIDAETRQILDLLDRSPHSVETLAERLGRERVVVSSSIETLREAGFAIVDRDGRLALKGEPGYPACLAHSLDAPFALDLHESIGTTNERARTLGRRGDREVTIIAAQQTRGRGRRGRAWTSPSGGLWGTVLFQPTLSPRRRSLLTLAGAVAVVQAVEILGVVARIKWPNDVLVGEGDRKLAGILSESGRDEEGEPWVAVGIGLNADVDPNDVPEGGASLREFVDSVDRCPIGRTLLEAFDELRDRPAHIRSRWRETAETLGRRVRVETPGGSVVGWAEDIDDTGALRIATDGGTKTVTVGDCEHLRPV